MKIYRADDGSVIVVNRESQFTLSAEDVVLLVDALKPPTPTGSRRRPGKKNMRWTAELDAALMRMRAEEKSVRQIGDTLGVSVSSISNRIIKLGLLRNTGPQSLSKARAAKQFLRASAAE